MKLKVLVYDIETCLSLFWGFRPGKQVVRSNQLLDGYFMYNHIICITYGWVGQKKVHVLDWGKDGTTEKDMLLKFQELLEEADIVIGKNNRRFDDKHITTNFWLNDIPMLKTMTEISDDLETQIRKHFYLSSYSLDYVSKLKFGDGKKSMLFSDWTSIAQKRLLDLLKTEGSTKTSLTHTSSLLFNKELEDVLKDGQKSLNKMLSYGKKDTADTMRLIESVWPYIKPKFNPSKLAKQAGESVLRCRKCGSTDIGPNGSGVSNGQLMQRYVCKNQKCRGNAGSLPITAGTQKYLR